ncbi:hypothetical protein [Pseudooceanicola sp. MF1-13]|uniref:hypothetical protein n=1 Tax=Pseudooceanicola sp. MF1-13 TaxID=3379095 RepID=UPI003891F916
MTLTFLNLRQEWSLSLIRIMFGHLLLEPGQIKHLNYPECPINGATLAGIAAILELVLENTRAKSQ